jgi:CrcB protein
VDDLRHQHGVVVAARRGAAVERSTVRPLRTGIAVGFCGGFTTFSTVSVQVFLDARSGDTSFALLYLAATIAGGVIAAALGYYAGRALAP